MSEYVDIETAIGMPGLRVVLTPGIPGPWSESAKAVLHVKQLDYVKARQEVLGPNLALQRWSAQTSAPVLAWNDEKPCCTWPEQLYLCERLAPEPALIPNDFDQRVLMFGLANEIMGQNGFIWNRRHLMVRDFTTADRDEKTRDVFAALGDKYSYSAEAAAAAPGRCAAILEELAGRLVRQDEQGSPYFIGDALTALDLYWASAAALIEPLPDSDCPMSPLFRDVYTNTDPVLQDAVTPALLAHRDFIYQRYLELPIKL